MISRFATINENEDVVYLDVNEIQNNQKLPISIDNPLDDYGYMSVNLCKSDINDLIKVLRNKLKQIE